MPETTSQFGHCEGSKSKAYTSFGDLWLEEQDFFSKLTKHACVWMDFPRLEHNEQWFFAAQRGDTAKGFAKEYGKFFAELKNRIENKQPPLFKPIINQPGIQ